MKPIARGIVTPFFILFFALSSSAQRKKDYTQFVNPFVGTGGHGHTYPGAVVPFGMVQLSPDTRLDGWDGCSGYYYTDTLVYGFSHTHLSGTGIEDYCDVLFMPTTGEPKLKNTEYISGFKKKNEIASPGYYKTHLDKYNIDAELTASTRVGVHRYTFPKINEANIIIDLLHRDQVLDSWIEVVNDHEIRGFRESRSWAADQSVYFYAKFSKPFKTYGIALNDTLQPGKSKLQGKNIKMYIRFDNPGEVIAKVGISSVSTDGALKNLDAEVPHFDFKKVEKAAKILWENELSKIEVEGGGPSASDQREGQNMNPTTGYNTQTGYYHPPKQKKEQVIDYAKKKQAIFYTALYHAMLAPNVYSDVDGQYRGMDQKVHTANGFSYYTVFSLWDTYRAEDPLLNLIDRKRTLDFIKSFLAMYEQGGLLPIWPLASNETYCMVGNHSIPVIVDAYAKGIRGFDAEEAFTAMKAAVNRNQFGLDSYRKNGVVLADDEPESVSKTLEYAIDDWCIAQMAKMLNKPDDYKAFIQRAQYWKNNYNNQNGFMQARTNGGWYTPFEPTEINNNYTEGNSWQYSFLAPQDIETLADRMGGKAAFEAKLDELFTTGSKLTGRQQDDVSGLIGQYAHGNEPSHHMAYLYNFTNSPEKTQYYINKILREEYSDKPDGLSGNEDCGQMSAWYVISSLGIYNIAPGQQQFQIGMPQFDKAVINLENGKKFTILNSGANISSNNIYLQGMNLNKRSYNKIYLDYADIANGGTFEVFTGRLPNKLFVQDLEKPTSRITDELIIPNPYLIAPAKAFKEPFDIQIKCADTAAKIYYTLDGSVPSSSSILYLSPIHISSNTTVKAIAIENGKSSFVDEGTFFKIRSDIKLTLVNKYLANYADEGDNALINGIRGKANWRLGNWQGYQGNDLVAIIDMGQVKPIKQVSLGTLQDTRSWIVFPPAVEYWASDDGVNYKLAATVNTKIDIKDLNVQTQEFTTPLNVNARYIKLVAKQYGPLPAWHESKGQPSYIFADEITVE
ncbi:GH92 family glycosyl hydrolase [Mucilaginibacter gotjawali]|uniref:Alpha-1,2-mannosidase n=2 Tax=Mucilaginibacter gotjawali TaxID=1550579 RepID=A0A839S7U5_9SPHI|nr:GH92 family glycosyl hydrolase [Mucilaginibacter gotjawali]MBB3054191.1 putative alpha-1,2-mannosidase [Mucilaginibacter gotjawali]BAU54462.1 Glycosyl hydrolase family 92 [Mucilaginibacter gotjawali]